MMRDRITGSCCFDAPMLYNLRWRNRRGKATPTTAEVAGIARHVRVRNRCRSGRCTAKIKSLAYAIRASAPRTVTVCVMDSVQPEAHQMAQSDISTEAATTRRDNRECVSCSAA